MPTSEELVIATFNDEDKAEETLKELKKWSKSLDIKFTKTAVVVKDYKGKTTVHQDQDVSAGAGTVFGAVVGALVGLIGGPGGAAVGAAAGAATGGVTAAAVNLGFSKDEIESIRTSLPPRSSALIALVEDHWVDSLTDELNRYSHHVWHRALPEDYYEGAY
jgi:uncharacterized membrane protein